MAISNREMIDDVSKFYVRGTNIPLPEIYFEHLVVAYKTGRSILLSGSGRDKKTRYRSGCLTPLGDLEDKKWAALAKSLVERENEQELYQSLLGYVTDTCPWLHSKDEREEYALMLHCRRMFKDPEWAGYKEFHEKYFKGE